MEIFEDAGVVVLSNNDIPEGKEYQFKEQKGFWQGVWNFFRGKGMMVEEVAMEMDEGAVVPQMAGKSAEDTSAGLAEDILHY